MNLINFDDVICQEKIFGLEIIDGKIKVLKLKLKRGKLVVVSFKEEELKKELYENGVIKDSKAVAAIIKNLKDTAQPQKIREKYVNIVLPDDRVFIRIVKFPKELSKDEIRDAIAYKAKDLIAMPLDKVYWDWHRFPVEKNQNEIEVVISAVDKDCVDSYVQTATLAGLTPIYFDISGNAAVRYLFRATKGERKALLVRVDENSSTLSLYLGGGVRYQTIVSEGYSSILSELAKKTGLDTASLEKSIFEDEASTTQDSLRQNLDPILKTSFKELTKEIEQTLDYYVQSYESKKIDSTKDKTSAPIEIYIYGKGASIFEAKNLMDEKPFELKTFSLGQETSGARVALLRRQHLPANIVLIGISLRNLGIYRKLRDINLVPEEMKQKYIQSAVYKTIFLYIRMLFWSVILVFVMIGSTYFYMAQYEKSIQSRLKSLRNYTESKLNADFKKDIEYVNTTSQSLGKLYSIGVDWEKFYSELADAKPEEVKLNDVLVTQDENVWKTVSLDQKVKVKEGYIFLVMNGFAPDRQSLQDFENNLRDSDVFDDVRSPISNFESKEDIKFSLYVTVDTSKIELDYCSKK